MRYTHAAVCIDLRSKKARQLLARALDLVGRDGRLSVITVLELGTFDEDREGLASLIEEEHAVRSAHLARLCESAGRGDADQRVLVGPAPEQIAAFARDHGCDLVVVGEHDAEADQAVLGSTADAILRRLACDALLVKDQVVRS